MSASTLLLVLDLVGIAVFAASGALTGVQKQLDLFGVVFIAGATAPPGRRMGHAGAIVGGEEDTAQAKKRILAECGIAVAETPSDMATTLLARWGR